MDSLTTLLSRFNLRAEVFHTGELCGVADFDDRDQAGHLHLLREGKVIVHHHDRPSFEITEPSLLFYPHALSHRLIVPATSKADIVCATVIFGGIHYNPLARALPDYLLFRLSDMPAVQQLLDMLFEEAFHDTCGRQLVLDRLCDVLVVQVIRQALEAGAINSSMLASLSDPGLSRVLAALHADPGAPWTLDRMSELAGMSRTSFAMRFHQILGVTPADYLAGSRISLAQMLLDKEIPVKTVALDVGYGSQAAFAKAFKAHLGISPRAWTKRSASSH